MHDQPYWPQMSQMAEEKRSMHACLRENTLLGILGLLNPRRGKPLLIACHVDVIGQGGTKDLTKHEQTNLHIKSHQGFSGIRPLHSYLGPMRKESIVSAEIKFAYFLGEHHLPLLLADHCNRLFSHMFPDSSIAKDFNCGRTKATALLKVIAKNSSCFPLMSLCFLVYKRMKTTDITVTQQSAIMLRYFDNFTGKVRCVFHALESVEGSGANHLFQAIDKHFGDGPVKYDRLVGLGTDGCNVMMGKRNSVLSRFQLKQPALVAYHCNCHIAALIANHACKVINAQRTRRAYM